MKNYLRYSAELFIYFPISYIAFLIGGAAPLLAIAAMTLSQVALDNALPEDRYNPTVNRPWLMDLMLFAHLPAGVLVLTLMCWSVTPGDLLGLGGALHVWLPFVTSSHQSVDAMTVISSGLLAGFILSGNSVVAHELVHRRSRPLSLTVGRLILGLHGDAQFELAHVFGHHVNVGMPSDPATARRGESLYKFFLRSTVGQYQDSAAFELKRLRSLGKGFWSPRNRVLRGLAMTLVVGAAVYLLAGVIGVATYALCIVYAKFILEAVNYIQHYGLVRAAGARTEPRHSWDCMGAASTAAFYSLSRHSHHHAKPAVPFWNLHVTAADGGLHLKWGYLASMIMAMIPPLWFRVSTPLLIKWDVDYASADERPLAQEANVRSGIYTLMRQASTA